MAIKFENTIECAKQLDNANPLKKFRDQFYIPILHGKESIYLKGNSLGLQPKPAQDMVLNIMEDWANFGSEARVSAKDPWINYDEMVSEKMAPVLGALPREVIVMNQLTPNLHLLLTSFYHPKGKRNKIIYEENAFSSDLYALQSHIKLAGLNEAEVLIEIKSRESESTLRPEDIIAAIQECGEELALVLLGGVNYYTGQLFNMKAITKAAHEAGAVCGFDLAHAVGNAALQLHDWNVDFACWCSYKYLNGGPGAVGGAFIHQRYHNDASLPRLAGWWGNKKETRFNMLPQFEPEPSAEGWQLSGPPILSIAVLKASLQIFEDAGIERIVETGKQLGAYLQFVLDEINGDDFEIITPRGENEFGCQVSFKVFKNGKHVLDILKQNSVLADWKEPDVIRIAAVPLYNSFEEIFRFGQILQNAFHHVFNKSHIE